VREAERISENEYGMRMKEFYKELSDVVGKKNTWPTMREQLRYIRKSPWSWLK
jgi:hypothetical protein